MIYFIQDPTTLAIKIGYAASPEERIKTLQTGNASELVLLSIIPGEREQEAQLHQQFRHLRIAGEWFKPGPPLLAYLLRPRPHTASSRERIRQEIHTQLHATSDHAQALDLLRRLQRLRDDPPCERCGPCNPCTCCPDCGQDSRYCYCAETEYDTQQAEALARLLREAVEVACLHHDGHLTIMRFTTGWKCMYQTPDLSLEGRQQVDDLLGFSTLRDALEALTYVEGDF